MKNFALLVAVLACTPALANPTTQRHGLLADAEGMTLYIFKEDARLKSNCYDACAKAWPPFLVADDTKADAEFVPVKRKDGTRQWAYKGQPLYRYLGDESPGDTSGDGSGKTWFVVRVKGAP